MFGRSHRFHGYGSLRAVYQRGRNARGSMMSLRYGQRDTQRPYRVAVVVSRKVSKSAVVRNRIRRRVYEAARDLQSDIESGTDLVFTVYSEQLATMPAKDLQSLVAELLQKTHAAK
jgi:ribonuclease P protein component